MATPEIASSPPTINFGVMWSPRNNTLEIKANAGSSRLSKPNADIRDVKTWPNSLSFFSMRIATIAAPIGFADVGN